MKDRHPLRRLVSALAVALGVGPAAGAVAETPRSVAPEAAPAAWIEYAGVVSQKVTAKLSGQEPAALRLRDYMAQIPGADPKTPAPLALRIWVDDAGGITRVDFPPFAHQEPNDDLHGLLVGMAMPRRPPKGMLLPLRLQIRVELQPEAVDGGQPAAAAPSPS